MDVNSYLTKLVKQLYVSKGDREKIDSSFSYLAGKIHEHFLHGIDRVNMFGSFDRGTELPQGIDKESDVDVMVIFRKNEYQPDTYLKHLSEFANKIYPRSDISPDHPAITVVLHHTKFELVPAFKESLFFGGEELKIPAPRNKELKWITTTPEKLKKDLLEKDKNENGNMFPLIKLIKYFNTRIGRPYDSFVIEEFAISRSYSCKNLRDYFFELINDLDADYQNERQKAFIAELKARKENLITLEKRNLTDYMELEMQKFLPLIS